MSKEITVVAWNLLDRINVPEVQQEIFSTGLDIGVFPEAVKEDEGTHQATIRAFAKEGYTLYQRPYDDNDGRQDRHSLIVAAKPELVHECRRARVAGRNALSLYLHGGTKFMGVHFDDRTERRRLPQARGIAQLAARSTILGGDFNALYARGLQARLFRVGAPFTRLLPSMDPAPGVKIPKLKRMGSLSQRTTGFAKGTTMQALMDAGFEDASQDGAATMVKGPLKLQLDRILYRGDVEVIEPTTVHDGGNLSDHKQIRARLLIP